MYRFEINKLTDSRITQHGVIVLSEYIDLASQHLVLSLSPRSFDCSTIGALATVR